MLKKIFFQKSPKILTFLKKQHLTNIGVKKETSNVKKKILFKNRPKF